MQSKLGQATLPLAVLAVLTLLILACGGDATATPRATSASIISTEIPIETPAIPPANSDQTISPENTPNPENILTSLPDGTSKPISNGTPGAIEPTATPTSTNGDNQSTSGGTSMGGAALGGSAETTLLAQKTLFEIPNGPLAWVAHESTLAVGQSSQCTRRRLGSTAKRVVWY